MEDHGSSPAGWDQGTDRYDVTADAGVASLVFDRY
jgi:hypothetical protein